MRGEDGDASDGAFEVLDAWGDEAGRDMIRAFSAKVGSALDQIIRDNALQ